MTIPFRPVVWTRNHPHMPIVATNRSAVLSACGTYRYQLWRHIPCALRWVNPIAFMLFNPSTADALQEDQTSRKGIGFSQRWGCSEMYFLNLYAFRSRDPKKLWTAADPVGPDNDKHIREVLGRTKRVVLGWGASLKGPHMKERVQQVVDIIKELNVITEAIQMTKDYKPAHPVMLGYKNELVEVDLDRLVESV